MKSKLVYSLLFLLIGCFLFIFLQSRYKSDKEKYEPKFWLGFFDYRLNFRDLGESLNQCLGQTRFKTHVIYRSNKYFSGWSCDKIGNPDKIYSLNFNPKEPHRFFCLEKNGDHLQGISHNPTFEIFDIENLDNWKNPEFNTALCGFFQNAIEDLNHNKSFLFHCDVGRDRTGAFAAMLTLMLAEQENLVDEHLINAIECDYEKTSSLEFEKFGKMAKFAKTLSKEGGISNFIEKQCHADPLQIKNAAKHFISHER